jgi:MFS family permease
LKDTVLPACSDADRKRIMAVIKFGTFLALLNETIINVALTKLTSVFAVSENTVQWLTSGYMLVLGILVPVTAFLIERLSTRELYLASMSIFLIGTVFAACSMSFPMLLCARLFQGLGAGVMMPLLMNTIMVLNPPEKRGAAMGSALLIVLFAPAVGPTFSGVVLQLLSWRWIFIIIIPLAAVSVVTGWLFLKNVTEKKRRGLDVFSLALSTVGFGGLLYGINELCSSSSGLSTGAAALAAGAAALVAFVVRQLKVPDPLLDVRVFRSPMFSLGMLLITLTYVIMFANYVLMPMFMQSVIGLSVFATGLAVLPGGIIGSRAAVHIRQSLRPPRSESYRTARVRRNGCRGLAYLPARPLCCSRHGGALLLPRHAWHRHHALGMPDKFAESAVKRVLRAWLCCNEHSHDDRLCSRFFGLYRSYGPASAQRGLGRNVRSKRCKRRNIFFVSHCGGARRGRLRGGAVFPQRINQSARQIIAARFVTQISF